MKMEMKLAGVDGVMEMLRKMPAEVVSKRGGPVKTALRKGAKVIHEQAKQNLQVSIANTTEEGKLLSTGLLLKNLVITRGKAPTVGKGERYLVRVRRKAYVRSGKPVTTLASAQLLEYGSEKQNAEPWLRPAFQAKAEQAILTTEKSLIFDIERIAKKLASQNRN